MSEFTTGREVPVEPATRSDKLSVTAAVDELFGERSGESPATASGRPEEPRRDDEQEKGGDKQPGTPEPEPPAEEPGAAEPEAPPPAADAVTDDPEYEIRVGDKTQSVRLSELQNGYLRQADYSRKTGDLAQVRKDYEQAKASIEQERTTYGTLLKQLRQQVESNLMPAEELKRMQQLDPVGFLLAKEQQKEKIEYLNAIQQEEALVNQRKQAEHARWVQQARSDASNVLLQQIPEWRSEETRNRELAEMSRVGAESYGYTPQELSQILDPRFVMVLRDAASYRQGKGQTNGIQAKRLTPQPGRPVPAKRSVPQTDPDAARRSVAQQRFNRAPSINNAVEALLAERGD